MEQFRLLGSIVNALAVIVGSLIGLLLRRLLGGKAESEQTKSLTDHLFKGIALCVLAIGITGTIKGAVNNQILTALEGASAGALPLRLASDIVGERTLVIILSMAVGSVLGHLLHLDDGVNRLGNRIGALAKKRFGNVAEGFVSASLLFCVGSMTVVGSLNSGLSGDHSILFTKSTIDFVSSIILTVSLGFGVLCSSAFVLIFQGSITLLAHWVAPFLTTDAVTCMTAVGSILIIGLSLNMLGITKLKIMNYMPAILLPILFIPLGDWISGLIGL